MAQQRPTLLERGHHFQRRTSGTTRWHTFSSTSASSHEGTDLSGEKQNACSRFTTSKSHYSIAMARKSISTSAEPWMSVHRHRLSVQKRRGGEFRRARYPYGRHIG